MLVFTGYEVLNCQYTGATLKSHNRSLKTRFAVFPRRFAYAVHKNFGVRLFGEACWCLRNHRPEIDMMLDIVSSNIRTDD
jgi:hypothetical protein